MWGEILLIKTAHGLPLCCYSKTKQGAYIITCAQIGFMIK